MVIDLTHERLRRAIKKHPEFAAVPLDAELCEWDIQILAERDEAEIEAFFAARRKLRERVGDQFTRLSAAHGVVFT